MIFLSEALIREPVGIAETEAGDWLVRFAEIDLGIIDRRSKKLRRFTAARPRLGTDGQLWDDRRHRPKRMLQFGRPSYVRIARMAEHQDPNRTGGIRATRGHMYYRAG
jgi:hypothetical protein